MTAVLARLRRLRADDAKGELMVGFQLTRLDSRWRTLHAVPGGERGAHIDHLVVGPGGVFTLNAERHPGAKICVDGDTVFVDGRQVPYVRNARHEAGRASRVLTAECGFPVAVTGVVVPVGAGEFVVRQLPVDVQVVNRRRVVRLLAGHPDVLDATTVEAIYAAARRSDCWRRPSSRG